MPVSREIAGNEQAREEQTLGLDSLLTSAAAGGKALGDGKYEFAAPKVDKSAQIAAARARIAQEKAMQQKVAQLRALSAINSAALPGSPLPSFGQAGVHESNGMSTEAGFFAPHEFSFNSAPTMGYAPPGAVEAGHRRPEDADPLQAQSYARDWYHAQNGRPSRRVGDS